MTRDGVGRVLVVAALLYLTVSALPVAAANTNVAVGSAHSTAAQFNAAADLDNVTVSGSGADAVVELATTTATVDDFEDGDTTIETAGWTGWSGDTGAFSTTSGADALFGTSANLTATNAVSTVNASRGSNQTVNASISGEIELDTATSGDRLWTIRFFDAGGRLVGAINHNPNGNLRWFATSVGGSDLGTWSPDTIFNYTLDFDASTDSVEIFRDGTLLANKSLPPSTAGWETVQLRVDTDSSGSTTGTVVDNFEVGGASDTKGSYSSQNHSVSNVTSGWTNLTLANASAEVTWRKFAGGSFTDVGSQTFTNTGNHTIDLSGHEAAETWRVNVTFRADSAWNVSTASFDTVFDVSSEEPTIRGLAFGNSGDYLYVVGANSDAIQQYDLDTAFDVGTATHNQSFSVASQDTIPRSVAFGDAGTKMYVSGASNAEIFQYDLATAWDVSSAAFNQSLNVGPQDSTPTGVTLAAGGRALLVAGNDNDSIFKFDLGTNWDMSSASLNQTLDVSGQDTAPLGLDISDGGAVLSLAANMDQNIDQWTLGTAFDLSTATHTRAFDISGETATPVGVEFDDTGSQLHVAGAGTDSEVNQYQLTQPTTAQLHDEGLLFTNNAPAVNNSTATPDGTTVSMRTVTLSINVSDKQFATPQNESVTVEFRHKTPNETSLSAIGTDTLDANGTASITKTFVVGGTHEWRVVATDDHGGQTTSTTFTFDVPGAIRVVNQTNASELIDSPVTVTGQFYSDGGRFTRTTTTGQLDATGLPTGNTFVLEVNASQDYHPTTVRIADIFQQDTVFLLNKSATTVDLRFVLEDPTGDFPSDSFVTVDRAINQSNTTQYTTIFADQFGAEGATTTLEQDVRYKISIRSPSGDVQAVGVYRAPTSETVTVRPGSPTIPLGNLSRGWASNASLNGTQLQVRYSDPEDLTSSVTVWIHEDGNTSNQLAPNQTFTNLGNFTAFYTLVQNESEKAWEVNLVTSRDGEQYTVEHDVGNRPDLPPNLSREWRLVAGVLVMFISSGVFSMLNAHLGGVVAAIEGGLLWWAGWLPGATSAAAIAIALFVAVLVHLYSRR